MSFVTLPHDCLKHPLIFPPLLTAITATTYLIMPLNTQQDAYAKRLLCAADNTQQHGRVGMAAETKEKEKEVWFKEQAFHYWSSPWAEFFQRPCWMKWRVFEKWGSNRPCLSEQIAWASPVVQWWRICLPLQQTRIQSPGQLSPGATTTDCVLESLGAAPSRAHATATEAHAPRAHAWQPGMPQPWEARPPQRESSPCALRLAKSLRGSEDSARPDKP